MANKIEIEEVFDVLHDMIYEKRHALTIVQEFDNEIMSTVITRDNDIDAWVIKRTTLFIYDGQGSYEERDPSYVLGKDITQNPSGITLGNPRGGSAYHIPTPLAGGDFYAE